MFVAHRNLVLISCFCLALVGVVAALKFQEESTVLQSSADKPVAYQKLYEQNDLKPDQSFFSSSTEKTYSIANPSPSPSLVPVADSVSASAYLVGDVKSGQIYIEKNSSKILPIASMSKLITAIAATDNMSPTTTIQITALNMDVPEDGSHLKEGEKFTLKQALYPMLLDSSNIAAEAIASTTDRPKFLELMKGYAWEIGMSSGAFFEDPTGIAPENAASAQDIFALARYLYKFRPDILALTRVVQSGVSTTTEHGSHKFVNIHPFVGDPEFIGGKTGHTAIAGDTMLTILNVNGNPIAVIILGARSGGRADDTRILLSEIKTVIR